MQISSMFRSRSIVAGTNKDSRPATSNHCVEPCFYKRTDELRAQFEQKISVVQSTGGMTPLVYTFQSDKFQFLTASAERVFTREILEDIIDSLRVWSSRCLEASHVSTPHVRVYVNACRRNFFRDQVNARWHYILSIARDGQRHEGCVVKVVTENVSESARGNFTIDRILSSPLRFNDLLVHSTCSPYAVQTMGASMHPLDSGVFLDGYFW